MTANWCQWGKFFKVYYCFMSKIFVINCKECEMDNVAATTGIDMANIAVASIRKTETHLNHTLTAIEADLTKSVSLRELIKNEPTKITTFGRLNLD